MSESQKCIHGRTEKQTCRKCNRMDEIRDSIDILMEEYDRLEES